MRYRFREILTVFKFFVISGACTFVIILAMKNDYLDVFLM